MKILIVGGGTAGLITALILKSRFEFIQIDIIKLHLYKSTDDCSTIMVFNII